MIKAKMERINVMRVVQLLLEADELRRRFAAEHCSPARQFFIIGGPCDACSAGAGV